MNALEWTFFLIAFLLGLLPAIIASGKGRDFLTWWVFGDLFFLVALPASILIRPGLPEFDGWQFRSAEFQDCPFCGGVNTHGVPICRYCHRELDH